MQSHVINMAGGNKLHEDSVSVWWWMLQYLLLVVFCFWELCYMFVGSPFFEHGCTQVAKETWSTPPQNPLKVHHNPLSCAY